MYAVRTVAPVFVLFRGLVALLALAYFLLAVAILALRYVVLPQVDHYVPQIEILASRALGVPVRIGQIEASWYRLHPQVSLFNAAILGPDGSVALALPRVDARLSWRSVFTARPQLLRLRIERPHLALDRDLHGLVRVAGFPVVQVEPAGPTAAVDPAGADGAAPAGLSAEAWKVSEHPLVQWILTQPDIRIHEASLTWRDATQRLPDLDLSAVSVQLQARRLGVSRFVLDVPGRFVAGRHAVVMAEWQRPWRNPLASEPPAPWRGQVYAAVDEIDLAVVRPWLGRQAPHDLAGIAAGRVWMGFEQGQWQTGRAELAVRNLRWGQGPRQPALALAEGRLAFTQHGSVQTLQADLSQALMYLPTLLAEPVVPLHRLTGDVRRDRALTPARWQFGPLQLDAGEPGRRASLVLNGHWQATADSPLGVLDLTGTIPSGEVGAVARWMPEDVDPEVRAWLRDGLRAGRVERADVVLQGPLAAFPFVGEQAALGQFRLQGALHDVAIDLEPGAVPAWPLISGLEAMLVIERDHLWADITQADIRLGAAERLQLGQSRLDIPDMMGSPHVDVTTQVAGSGAALLAYLAQSPLAPETTALREVRIDGMLEVPLTVRVGLDDAGEVAVQGRVLARDNRLRLPGVPAPYEAVQGELSFTESAVQIRDLRGRWLGGEIRVGGEVSGGGTASVRFQGDLAVATARQVWPDLALPGVSGRLPYQGEWRRDAQARESLTAQSSLQGVRLDLPAPLAKPAEQAWPLELTWQRSASGDESLVRAELAERASVAAQWSGAAPRPQRLALSLPGPARLPERGWQIDVASPHVDLDAWQDVWQGVDTADGPSRRAPVNGVAEQAPSRLPWADLGLPLRVQLQSPAVVLLGTAWRDVQASLEITSGNVVRLQVQAPQAQGRIGWRPDSAAGPTRLEVDLDYLRLPRRERVAAAPVSIASAPPSASEPAPSTAGWRDPARWPYVDLSVDQLVWGELDLGQLTLSASPDPAQVGWNIDRAVLALGTTEVAGGGQWRLGAAQSRSTWTLEATVGNVGDVLARLGMPDVVAGGHGVLQARAGWPGAPWDFGLERLEADLELDLESGRFLPVSSTAGRLLGILSLQSLARVVTFQGQNVFESGFAWDNLRSSARVAQGQLDLRGFEMRGQSAAAFLTGRTDLLHETQSLKVLVLPRVDASAAAVLAGVAINPIVGVGAFLTQWLLREPLAQALSLEYAVTGTWADPHVKRIPRTATPVATDPVTP